MFAGGSRKGALRANGLIGQNILVVTNFAVSYNVTANNTKINDVLTDHRS